MSPSFESASIMQTQAAVIPLYQAPEARDLFLLRAFGCNAVHIFFPKGAEREAVSLSERLLRSHNVYLYKVNMSDLKDIYKALLKMQKTENRRCLAYFFNVSKANCFFSFAAFSFARMNEKARLFASHRGRAIELTLWHYSASSPFEQRAFEAFQGKRKFGSLKALMLAAGVSYSASHRISMMRAVDKLIARGLVSKEKAGKRVVITAKPILYNVLMGSAEGEDANLEVKNND